MCIWIIHSWRSWLHCIICTCGWHPLHSHFHINWIRRRPHSVCLENIQCLSEHHFTQPWRNSLSQFTWYISESVQKKIAQTSINLKKLEVFMHPGNKVYKRNKTLWKILVWLTKTNIHHCRNYHKILWSFCIIMSLK